ncbi:Regulator of phospholipase D SRF1 [Candida viswanathii]|uniref:Regulator of phospholipase D SRF1 n=1 Tax=Candida viswanathii TaxID=5486 RepID=A0A367YNC8_9ASCO|nr:Regulator of phospholipase D SRF1 [Candida viswanathii]
MSERESSHDYFHQRPTGSNSAPAPISPNANSHHTDSDSIDVPMDPFENVVVNSYSHRATLIPPYVLDSISKAYRKDYLQQQQQYSQSQTNISDQATTKTLAGDTEAEKNENIYSGRTQDPYLRAIDNDWWKFKESIKHQTAYPPGQVIRDPEILKEYDLDGTWGGDERLKKEFANNISGGPGGMIQDVATGRFFFGLFHKKGEGENDTRVRSTAGYWMGENRSQLKPNLKRIFLFNPLVPLFLRMLIMVFCAIALALAGSVFVFSKTKYDGESIPQQPSTIMAIVVESCALVYVIYIAYDEYTGKPLGLREPMSKLSLILLDLLFIIFSAANLSLAFNTMNDDEWVCKVNKTPGLADIGLVFPTIPAICHRQRALAAFLFMVLFLWVLTFTVSLLRVIDRVNTPGPRNV